MNGETLTTVEVSKPGMAYTLATRGPRLDLHLAARRDRGTGPCICGFDRFARDDKGRPLYGFSIGGGTTGGRVRHDVCETCRDLIDGREVQGLNADLFAAAGA